MDFGFLVFFLIVCLLIFITRNIERIIQRKVEYNTRCINKWNREEKFYFCNTCSEKKKITLCCDCFWNGDHTGHDYYIYISEFVGCCDCGDANLMNSKTFCKLHAKCDPKTYDDYKYALKDEQQIEKFSCLLNVDRVDERWLNDSKIKLGYISELSYSGKLIVEYFINSQVKTDSVLKLKQVYSVYFTDGKNNQKNFFPNETRMLLWHGIKRKNLKEILKFNLKLPVSNGRFGKGIYFADRVTKSAYYSDCGYNQGIKRKGGLLLLCEVTVGDMYETSNEQLDLFAPPFGYNSVKGRGKYVPFDQSKKTRTSATVPIGKTVLSDYLLINLFFNEYVVYDTNRVEVKFIVEFERFSKNLFSIN